MVTKSKIIEINPELLNKISRLAKDKNTTEEKIVNEILEKSLENSDDVLDFSEFIGAFTTDKPFSAVEEVRKMRGKD